MASSFFLRRYVELDGLGWCAGWFVLGGASFISSSGGAVDAYGRDGTRPSQVKNQIGLLEANSSLLIDGAVIDAYGRSGLDHPLRCAGWFVLGRTSSISSSSGTFDVHGRDGARLSQVKAKSGLPINLFSLGSIAELETKRKAIKNRLKAGFLLLQESQIRRLQPLP